MSSLPSPNPTDTGPSLHRELLEKIHRRSARIGVIGMGYVGLPLMTAFAAQGFLTLGFDISEKTVAGLQAGASHIADVPSRTLKNLQKQGTFEATTDFSRLGECDALIICVPTPLTAMREPDLTAIRAASESIARVLRSGQLIVLESTTYPGTTEEVVKPILELSTQRAGEDFFLAFSPERIDPGNEKFPVHKVPKVVGGYTPRCLEAAVALYETVVETTVPVSSTQAAELTKLLENIFRCVNIALVNEMAMLCDRMKIDIWEVVDAASTKPYGFTRFLPGPGLGGHCIPIDPFYLSWKAREFNFQTNFIELAGEVNHAMPRFVVEKVTRALNDLHKSVRGSRIGLLGMSYKPDISDCRESPALEIAALLVELGAEISYHDPHVESVQVAGEEMRSQPLERVLSGDCVVLLTNHRAFDYREIAQRSRLILDTRDAFKGVSGRATIIKL